MRIVIVILAVFAFINCSSSSTGAPPSDCPTVVPGTGLAATAPDWTYDFTAPGLSSTSTSFTNVWTPEVTMSGEGNFEFEAYLNSHQTISFDPSNGLLLKAGLMKDYVLQAGQTFSSSTSSIQPGLTLPNADILGCGRTSLADGISNNLGFGTNCNSVWSFSLLDTCTDNGDAYGGAAAGVYGCGQGSAQSGTNIGASAPVKPIITPSTVVPATTFYKPTPAIAAATIVPPVTSARISTKQAQKPASGYDISQGFLYGRLEIKAKIPKGDWLWPAIWMMPKNQTGTISPSTPLGLGSYGAWPRSGEIDILESRGNSADCAEQYMIANGGAFGGTQSFASTLHWGPIYSQNAFSKTHTEYYTDKGYTPPTTATKLTLDAGFHTYGLRWSPKGLYTYIDDDKNHVLEVDFTKQNFYTRGTTATKVCLQKYAAQSGAAMATNSCQTPIPEAANTWAGFSNPWAAAKCNASAAPFDQPFILIMNLAIGGTAGEGTTAYFPDSYCQKPWHNPIPNPTGGSPVDTWSYPVANFFSAITAGNAFSGASYGGWQPSWTQPTLQVQTINYWTEPNAGAFGQLSPNAS